MAMRTNRRCLILVIAGLGLVSCHTGLRTTDAPVAQETVGTAAEPVRQEVLAIVDEMKLRAHEDFLSDGTVLVSNLVWFSVERPEDYRRRIAVHCQGLPAIGDRRLQLGDYVYFQAPTPAEGTDIELSNLKGLRFADSAPGSP
jgi:hypothetical protein